MRGKILWGAFVLLLMCPTIARATATPVLAWPSAEFDTPDGAPDFATWFADRLHSQPDSSRTPRWEAANFSWGPAFLTAHKRYVLPLPDGTVKATYSATGHLFEIGMTSNTTYFAASIESADLFNVSREIASDLALDVSQASVDLEVVIPASDSRPTYAESIWIVEFHRATVFGSPLGVNGFMVSVRERDLRVIAVSVLPWYSVSGTADVSASQAVGIAVNMTNAERGQDNATGELLQFTVRDGASFVFIVSVRWPAEDPACRWTRQTWIDATTGEAVYVTPPAYVCEDGAAPAGPWAIWALLLLPLTAFVVAISVFLHLSAERALDQFTRGQVFGFVVAHPGARYSEIRDALGVSNGTLAYHLWVLERTGFVRSLRNGRARMVFPDGDPVRQNAALLSRLQFAMLDAIHARGPSTQIEIARAVGVSKQRAHYNVKALRNLGLLAESQAGTLSLSERGTQAVVVERERLDRVARPTPASTLPPLGSRGSGFPAETPNVGKQRSGSSGAT